MSNENEKTEILTLILETVPFEKKHVLDYLDRAIRKWRERRDGDHHAYKLVAMYYVDAFQSVRKSLFGELLPAEKRGK